MKKKKKKVRYRVFYPHVSECLVHLTEKNASSIRQRQQGRNEKIWTGYFLEIRRGIKTEPLIVTSHV